MYLVLSFIAMVLIITIAGTAPPTPPSLTFFEKLGIATVFIFCCIVGISFTIRPNWFRQTFPKLNNAEKKTSPQVTRQFQGHHPNCAMFQNHIIQWRNKVWCAGCLGLLIGLCSAILFMILYVTFDVTLSKTISFFCLLLGFLALSLVFAEAFYQSHSPVLHVVINSILPLSYLLITIAVGEATGQFVSGLFTLLLCFLWIDTRIHLSKWRHSLLCLQCPESCKMFSAVS